MPTRDPIKIREKYKRLLKRAIIKLGGTCNECKSTDFRVLQIDHIENLKKRGEKRLSKRQLLMKINREDRPQNLQLLCANCHMIKTWRI